MPRHGRCNPERAVGRPVALSVVFLTLLPAMAGAAPVDEDPAVAARLTTSETVERIPLSGLRGPVECSVDALMRTIRLRSSTDPPAKLLSKIAGRTGGLCPTVLVRDGAVELTCRSRRFDAKFFHAMLDRGFYLPPAQLEAAFLSMAHTADDVESFVIAAKEVFATL